MVDRESLVVLVVVMVLTVYGAEIQSFSVKNCDDDNDDDNDDDDEGLSGVMGDVWLLRTDHVTDMGERVRPREERESK